MPDKQETALTFILHRVTSFTPPPPPRRRCRTDPTVQDGYPGKRPHSIPGEKRGLLARYLRHSNRHGLFLGIRGTLRCIPALKAHSLDPNRQLRHERRTGTGNLSRDISQAVEKKKKQKHRWQEKGLEWGGTVCFASFLTRCPPLSGTHPWRERRLRMPTSVGREIREDASANMTSLRRMDTIPRLPPCVDDSDSSVYHPIM